MQSHSVKRVIYQTKGKWYTQGSGLLEFKQQIPFARYAETWNSLQKHPKKKVSFTAMKKYVCRSYSVKLSHLASYLGRWVRLLPVHFTQRQVSIFLKPTVWCRIRPICKHGRDKDCFSSGSQEAQHCVFSTTGSHHLERKSPARHWQLIRSLEASKFGKCMGNTDKAMQQCISWNLSNWFAGARRVSLTQLWFC